MQNRTLYALISAALLTMTATVVAQAETNSPNASATNTSAEKPDSNFVLKVTPGEAWVKPGEAATFSVVAGSRSEQSLHLALRAPDGVRAVLSADVLDVFPGSGAAQRAADAPAGASGTSRAALTVAAPENATRSPYYVVVIGTAEDGTVRESKAIIHVRDHPHKTGERPAADKPAERPAAKPEPLATEPKNDAPTYKYDILERRFAAILERLAHIEKRLDRLEANAKHPEPKPDPAPVTSAARMTLSPQHAIVGADGLKVALLLAGGEKDQRIPLAVRYNESSGWKVGLEQDVVFVAAHGRAWIWVHLTPPAACEPTTSAANTCELATASVLEYAIVQPDSPGPYVAKGSATARMS